MRQVQTALLSQLAYTVLVSVAVLSESAIPFDEYGHVILRQGTPEADLKIEVYLDLACSDCALAWPVVNQVVDVYGHRAEFLHRLFPLPYHRTAFTAAKAAKTVRLYSDGNDASIASFFTAVFDREDEISNHATEYLTQPQIEATLSSWAVSSSGISVGDFEAGMANAEVDKQIRNQFKYGCLHGVYGTPQVFIGGVVADLDGEATFQDWQDILEPLLGSSTSTEFKARVH